MTAGRRAFSYRRVVVALDRASATRTALDIAARMAARWDSELAGLVLEDLRLLQAADLPVSHLIGRHGSGPGRLSAAEIERAFRVLAREARTTLGDVCARMKLRSSFEVRRGASLGAMLAAAGGPGLVVLGWGSEADAGGTGRETLHHLAAQAGCSLLVVGRAARPRRPVTVLFEGATDALAAGGELAEVEGRSLRIVIGPASSESAGRLERALKADPLPLGVMIEVRHLDALSLPAVYALLRGTPAGLLVLHRALLGPSERAIENLLGRDLADAVLILGEAQDSE